MEAGRLSVRDCIRFGWDTFKKRPWLFVGVTALTLILSALIPSGKPGESVGVQVALAVSSFLITTLLNLGLKNLMLSAHDSVEDAGYADLWHPRLYLHYLGITLFLGLAIFVGVILLIVPGIIVGLALGMGTYVVVDKGLTPIAALKESARITKGNRWPLFLLYVALIGINVLGLLAVVVGLVVSLPLSGLALAHAYRTLEKFHEGDGDVVDVEAHEVVAV